MTLIEFKNIERKSLSPRVQDPGMTMLQLMVRDLGSLNGTFVGSARITSDSTLEPGSLLSVGPVTFRASYGAATSEDTVVAERTVRAHEANEPKPRPSSQDLDQGMAEGSDRPETRPPRSAPVRCSARFVPGVCGQCTSLGERWGARRRRRPRRAACRKAGRETRARTNRRRSAPAETSPFFTDFTVRLFILIEDSPTIESQVFFGPMVPAARLLV
jgi:hypothetical protein